LLIKYLNKKFDSAIISTCYHNDAAQLHVGKDAKRRK